MNKETKRLIEIVGEFMNKELSEGCWINNNLDWDGDVISKIIYTEKPDIIWYTPKCYIIKDYNWNLILEEEVRISDIEILWHLDITAVEKYIVNTIDESRYMFINYDTISGYKMIHTISMDMMWNSNVDKEYIMPNKPINLYTTEELKDLIKLLEELWLKER